MAKILVIEDDASLRDGWVRVLTWGGHEVLEAEDGREGLSLHRRLHPSIILTDLNLPGVHGLDIIRQLREEPGLTIIATSGSSEDLEVARHLGVHTLQKPVAMDVLLAMVR
jgi:DNA-binding response OmpR family regulator